MLQMPALLIQPPRLVRRADVGRDRDDALGDLRGLAGEVDEEAAERLLGRGRAGVLAAEVGRDLRRGDGAGGAALEPLRRSRRTARPRASRLERRERVVGVLAELGRQLAVLRVVEQRGVVGGVALGGQRPALDRVGEDDRSGGRGPRRPGGSRRSGSARSWPPRSRKVASSSASSRSSTSTSMPLAQLRRVGAQQPLVLLVGHRVDAGPQVGPLLQQRAVLDHHGVPAGGLEHRGEAAGGDVRDDAVERLAVEVDDPHDLAEARDHRVRDRLPAGALVELGVADQRDLAPAARDVEVPGDVAVRERAPDRRGRAEADGAGASSRPGRGPSSGSGRTAGRRTRAASSGSGGRGGPSRWLIACSTGLACGLTLTRSGASSTPKYSAVIRLTMLALRRLMAADLHAASGSRARGWRGARCSSRATARAARRARASPGRARSLPPRVGGYSVKQ